MSTRYKARPYSSDPHVGIELEFDLAVPPVDSATIAAANAVAGLAIDYEPVSYNCPQDKWYAYEATMLAGAKSYTSTVENAVRFIVERGGFVDARCGLHVHLDMRHATLEEKREAFGKLFDAQERLWAMCDPGRKTNRDCVPVPNRTYRAWKGNAFWLADKYPTIEVRMMEASLDAVKINDWIATLQEVVNG